MANKYGYYMELSPNTFQDVRFLGITPKTDFADNGERVQRHNKEGTPVWVVSALVKYKERQPETENFAFIASNEVANTIAKFSELAKVRLVGLAGGTWSSKDSNQTNWTFRIAGVELVKE